MTTGYQRIKTATEIKETGRLEWVNPGPVIPFRHPLKNDPVPANAWSLARIAERKGWAVTVWYSRGYPPPKYDANAMAWTSDPVDSVTVHGRRGGQTFVSMFEDGKAYRSWTGSKTLGARMMSNTQLRKWLNA